MKPAQIRDKIKNIKEQKVVEAILIKTHERYRDEENYKERIAKQRAIIAEAENAIAIIQKEYDNAHVEIEKIKQNAKHENKVLVELVNYEKIQKLKETIKQLQEVERGKDINNT